MDYRHSVEFLYALGNEHKTGKLGLERITGLLRALGDPQNQSTFVHVAGTNGKGSTCAIIESGLRAAGRRTGLYTSPHLEQPTERIQIDGVPVAQDEFVRVFERVRDTAARILGQQATYFETITAMAFLLFAERKVECVALEVGLGGRLDATNVVTPMISVITPIDYDHEAWLGETIESIAAEKAGILKPGVPAIAAPQRPEAEQVLLSRAGELGVSLSRTSEWRVDELEVCRNGSRFRATRERALNITCPLAGEHQVTNALTAVAVLDNLGISAEAIHNGVGRARWPGRLECVSSAPEIWLDGAHNPAGARTLACHIQRFFSGRKLTLIFGTMRDKAVPEIAGTLFPLAERLILTAPQQARALDPHLIAGLAGNSPVSVAGDIAGALTLAAGDDVVFITGSLYLVGEARALLVK
jgi:dihydrofolate synthase/folylpolyglutamate synthase